MDKKDVISLVEVAERFAKAKGMENVDYQWLRKAPGRGASKEENTGNSLAVLKSIRNFNASNAKPIEVLKARGYDGTPKQVLIIPKNEIIRLKGYVLRGGSGKRGPKQAATSFKIVGKMDF